MNFPEQLAYTKEHEWVRVEGNTGIIGITDYAQGELGDIVFVELPAVGTAIRQGQTFGTIEAVKAVSDLYAPVSGEVTAVNTDLDKTPENVNKDPYQGGWMVKVRMANPAEVKALLDAKSYRILIGK
jgi:glycine cleavage system H protein